MRYTPYRNGLAPLMRSVEVRSVLREYAAEQMARARINVGKETGKTAASLRLVNGLDRLKGTRVKVSIYAAGAAVAQHFGNRTTKATLFLTRGMKRVK
jgi:hypothetical protein